MASALYTAPDLPDDWIGEDEHGALMKWSRKEGGWADRTAYAGPKRALTEVAPALARGTGWPGAGVGRRPRAGGVASSPVTIRATQEERAAWERKAGERSLSDWAREVLNKAAAR